MVLNDRIGHFCHDFVQVVPEDHENVLSYLHAPFTHDPSALIERDHDENVPLEFIRPHPLDFIRPHLHGFIRPHPLDFFVLIFSVLFVPILSILFILIFSI